MNHDVKISIIIPMYNVEKYISQCILSLINQNIDKEIIIIDDGSTDSSYTIASEFQKKYDYIRVLSQQNSGQSVARNAGLRLAKGKYIFFIDSDDYILENSLIKLYDLCECNDLDWIKTDWYTFIDDKNELIHNKCMMNDIKNRVMSNREYFITAIGKCYNVIPWNGLIKREYLNKHNIKFPEKIQFEDNTFTLNMFMADLDARIMEIEYPFYYVRIREKSTTTEKVKPKKIYDMLENIKIMNEIIEKYNIDIEFQQISKKSVSLLVFHMTSYYYRLNNEDKAIVKKSISKVILKNAIKYPYNRFQKYKVWSFLYLGTLLNIYQNLKRKAKHV